MRCLADQLFNLLKEGSVAGELSGLLHQVRMIILTLPLDPSEKVAYITRRLGSILQLSEAFIHTEHYEVGQLIRESQLGRLVHAIPWWRMHLASLAITQRANIRLPSKTRERTAEGLVYWLDLAGVANAAECIDTEQDLAVGTQHLQVEISTTNAVPLSTSNDGACVPRNSVCEIQMRELDGHKSRAGLIRPASMTGDQPQLDGAIERSRVQKVSRPASFDGAR